MSTVGIFAGRGDVIVALFLAFFVGFWAGWKAHQFLCYFKKKAG